MHIISASFVMTRKKGLVMEMQEISFKVLKQMEANKLYDEKLARELYAINN